MNVQIKIMAVLLLISGTVSAAENPALAEIKKLNEAYASKSIWADVAVNGFKKAKDAKAFVIGKGEFRLAPAKGYYSSFEGEVCLSDEHTTLYIDKEAKNIGIVKKGMKEVKKNSTATGIDFKKLKGFSDSLILSTDVQKGVNKITVLSHHTENDVIRTEYYYSTETHLISKIVYWYNPDGKNDYGAEKTEVVYTYHDVSKMEKDFFETEKVVAKKLNGKYEVKDSWKSYKVWMMD